GQHRIEGGNAASIQAFLPVTAFLGISKEEQAFHFIVINSRARKVAKHDIDAVIPKAIYEHLQKRLVDAGITETLADIVYGLDNDSTSPFERQIAWGNNPEGTIGKGGIDNLIKES